MDNMKIYNTVRECPKDAQRPIQAGKLKGKTDINPMWRIKMLTELFGPCGVGWKTENETFWTTPGAGGEVVAWCSMNLRYKNDDSWSDPVFGIGVSMLVDTQRGSLASNDEAYKMAYTDAISVACKALGFAADIYWQGDSTKYARNEQRDFGAPAIPTCTCQRCNKAIIPINHGGRRYSAEEIAANSKNSFGSELCWSCMKELRSNEQERAAFMGDPNAAGF